MNVSKRIGRFKQDRLGIGLLLSSAVFLFGIVWLHEHPGDDPWAPLDLRQPPGWTTPDKLAGVRRDPAQCYAVLDRSDVAYRKLDPLGDGTCRRDNRTVLEDAPLRPAEPPVSCAVAAGLTLWLARIQPEAEAILGSRIARIDHFGAYSCRRIYGRDAGAWSEHATGNAIDIAGFVLEDGQRLRVVNDWDGEGDESRFLHTARDAACDGFGTVLSPDYNAAHADHFHLDQEARGWGGVCR